MLSWKKIVLNLCIWTCVMFEGGSLFVKGRYGEFGPNSCRTQVVSIYVRALMHLMHFECYTDHMF